MALSILALPSTMVRNPQCRETMRGTGDRYHVHLSPLNLSTKLVSQTDQDVETLGLRVEIRGLIREP
jgi:hypothetical protein